MATPDSPKNTAIDQNKIMTNPGYLSYRPDGVFINLKNTYSSSGFFDFVNKMFSGDSRFEDLDYEIFLKLLYDADWLEASQNKGAELKLATGIVHFPPHRRELYRPVKVLDRGRQAEYVFEPVTITVTYDEPVYGEPGAGGVAPVTGQVSKTKQQQASLDFDEFVAAMWAKGVKYGIDTEAVNKVINEGTSVRMIIANYLPPSEGKDAYIQELSPDLHRDNSPKTLLNGKADLRAFKNRFPQVAKGTRLLKKVPREFGKHGYKVTGEVIVPPEPLELNLLALISQGTVIVQDQGIDYIVAELDGFLTIDPVLNLISINEKIETTAGISMKTTGDLMLGVDEFIEHGEVQEGRVVNGKHMTFMSNVFGSLVSKGGNIVVKGNLTGGGAESLGGNITVGRASRAVIRAQDGTITAQYCENCTLIGRIIHVEHAVNCELIATELHAEAVEGCMIAAESVRITSSTESKNRETFITMVIPDLSVFDLTIAGLQAKMAECLSGIASKKQEIEQLKADQDFAKFLALYERIKSGAIKLSSEQAGNWQLLMTKNAKTFNQVELFNKQILALERLHGESAEELANVSSKRNATGTGINCVIDKVTGLTVGQTMKSAIAMEIFRGQSNTDIKNILQNAGSDKARIFSDDDGSISWRYKPA